MRKFKTYRSGYVVLLILAVCALSVQAQDAPSYKDVVVENPTAEADMKTVSDYTNAIVDGNLKKARSILAKSYMLHGPSTDSSNVEKEMASWEQNYKVQSDRKVAFITQTFKVVSGAQKGNWVSLWGNYTFTSGEKTVTLPFQYTASVSKGKILKAFMYYDNLAIYQQLGYTLTPPVK